LKSVHKTASSLSIFFATSGQFLNTYSDIRYGIMGSDFLPRSSRSFKISEEATFNRVHRKNESVFEIFWILASAKIAVQSSICLHVYPVQPRNLNFWFDAVDKLAINYQRNCNFMAVFFSQINYSQMRNVLDSKKIYGKLKHFTIINIQNYQFFRLDNNNDYCYFLKSVILWR